MERFGFVLRHSLWLLAVVFGFGLVSWVGFAYVALRVRRPRFVVAAVVTAALAALMTVGLVVDDRSGWTVAAFLVSWVGAVAYGFALNTGYLAWHAARRRRPMTVPAVPAAPCPTRVVEHLDRLSARLMADPAMTARIREAYLPLQARLRDLLLRSGQLAANPEGAAVVERIVEDYLPTSLDAYASLPPSFALATDPRTGVCPHDELVAQLRLLDREVVEIGEATFAGDAARLRAQGNFLRERFGGSALDLP